MWLNTGKRFFRSVFIHPCLGKEQSSLLKGGCNAGIRLENSNLLSVTDSDCHTTKDEKLNSVQTLGEIQFFETISA